MVYLFVIIDILRRFAFQFKRVARSFYSVSAVPGLFESGYPLVFVGLMTFILIMSSVTMVLAVEAGHPI